MKWRHKAEVRNLNLQSAREISNCQKWVWEREEWTLAPPSVSPPPTHTATNKLASLSWKRNSSLNIDLSLNHSAMVLLWLWRTMPPLKITLFSLVTFSVSGSFWWWMGNGDCPQKEPVTANTEVPKEFQSCAPMLGKDHWVWSYVKWLEQIRTKISI